MAKTPNEPFPIEPEYGRNIAPIVDKPAPVPVPDELDDAELIENEDGSATLMIEEDEPEDKGDFYDNLAERLEETELRSISSDLLNLIEKDKEARKMRDEQYADGIRRTGLGNEAPGGADFVGASKVVHPVLAEGCIDFAARAIKEIFPASGPCKTQIIGEATEPKIEKAERKKQYMNWQLTKQIKEYRAELEQLLTQLPLGGSQYLKIWYDDRVERPRTEFISIDDVYVPFAASDFYTAHRKTHRQLITRGVFQNRIDSGLYRDIEVVDTQLPEETDSKKATDKIEGLEDTAYNEDGLREIYEIYVQYKLSDPMMDSDAPYIITIDVATGKVLAIYRNWEDDGDNDADDICPEPLDWIVEFKFIPWRGAYGVGLPHIIGSLSGALTGALRALMDSAHANNAPAGLKLKGARASGQNVQVGIGEIAEFEASPNIDDIRKMFMPMPYNPPSTVLFQLLDWLTNQAKGVVGTAEEKIAEASNNMPMGTALALIEQGSQTFSAIHARLHASQMKVLEILHRINRDNLNDQETVEELGELIVSRADFEGPMDIIPVSDPNIFSEAQRYAQFQAVLQLAGQFPQFYKLDQLNKRGLRLLNVPESDELLIETFEPERLDAVQENVKASEGKQPLKAYEDQDHLSHMMTHLHYALSPIFCANPIAAMPALPTLINHVVKEHLPMYYMMHIKAATDAAIEVFQGQGIQFDSEDQLRLRASAFADERMAQDLAPVMQMLQQAQQLAQQFQPPPQLDPQSQVAMTIGQAQVASLEKIEIAKLQQKAKEVEANRVSDQQKIAAQAQADSMKTQIENEGEMQQAIRKQQTEIVNNVRDNATDIQIEQMRMQQHSVDQTANQIQQAQGTEREQVKEEEEKQNDPIPQIAMRQDQIEQMLQSVIESIQQNQQEKPKRKAKRIVKDDLGEITGVMRGDEFLPVVRDEEGNIIGIGEDE